MRPDLNWVGVLEHHADRTPGKPLAVFGTETITYAGMRDRAAAVAGGLSALGVGRGDVVGLLAHNSIDFLTTIYASNHLGAIAMPVNWRLAGPELAFILDHSQAKVLVCGEELVESGERALSQLGHGIARVAIGTADGWEPLAELARSDPAPRVAVAGDDVHRLMYTSGTTGRPKGVMLTHANLAWKNYAHITEFGFTADDVGLACGPLYHVGALDLTTTSLLAVGATTHIHPTFDAAAVVDDIEGARVSCIWTAPAMVRAILDVPGVEHRDLTSLRLLIAGGAQLPIPYVERMQRTFPSAWLADAYGLTETVSGDTFLDRASTITKIGSVGRPCHYLELEIWDEQAQPLGPGQRGEIVLRGPKVFKGYWRDEEATARAFAGGWFHTGDIGVRDEDGYVYIVDRLKDMIVSGGENVASSEVERVLDEHPAIAECAVVGRPDEKWGEVPVAFVVLKEGTAASEEELLAHCRSQLATFKVPKAVTFIAALPRNPSGKVLKRELRATGDDRGTSGTSP